MLLPLYCFLLCAIRPSRIILSLNLSNSKQCHGCGVSSGFRSCFGLQLPLGTGQEVCAIK
jgi:hypothetical protein